MTVGIIPVIIGRFALNGLSINNAIDSDDFRNPVKPP
jgi:hypothetical protein